MTDYANSRDTGKLFGGMIRVLEYPERGSGEFKRPPPIVTERGMSPNAQRHAGASANVKAWMSAQVPRESTKARVKREQIEQQRNPLMVVGRGGGR